MHIFVSNLNNNSAFLLSNYYNHSRLTGDHVLPVVSSDLRYSNPWILFFMTQCSGEAEKDTSATQYIPRKGKCFLEIAFELIIPQLLYFLGSKGVGGGESCSRLLIAG